MSLELAGDLGGDVPERERLLVLLRARRTVISCSMSSSVELRELAEDVVARAAHALGPHHPRPDLRERAEILPGALRLEGLGTLGGGGWNPGSGRGGRLACQPECEQHGQRSTGGRASRSKSSERDGYYRLTTPSGATPGGSDFLQEYATLRDTSGSERPLLSISPSLAGLFESAKAGLRFGGALPYVFASPSPLRSRGGTHVPGRGSRPAGRRRGGRRDRGPDQLAAAARGHRRPAGGRGAGERRAGAGRHRRHRPALSEAAGDGQPGAGRDAQERRRPGPADRGGHSGRVRDARGLAAGRPGAGGRAGPGRPAALRARRPGPVPGRARCGLPARDRALGERGRGGAHAGPRGADALRTCAA